MQGESDGCQLLGGLVCLLLMRVRSSASTRSTGTAVHEAALVRPETSGEAQVSPAEAGAALSSDDFGSSVERAATLHPLWRAEIV